MDKVLYNALREKISAEVKDSLYHKRWIDAMGEMTKQGYTPTLVRYLVDLRHGNTRLSKWNHYMARTTDST